MENIDAKFYDERLQLLKQATLLNYFDDFSFQEAESKNLELLDIMLEHLYKGDLDFCFKSKSLKGIDLEEKDEIYKLVHKYMPLCFYVGNPDFWLDSVEGVTLGGDNADFICMKILDNYDFLLGVARDGGEEALKQIEALKVNDNFSECSVVDTLRNYFSDDDLLREIIVDMSKSDGNYKEFNNEEKAIMCTYPNGVLVKKNKDNNWERIPVDTLNKKIRDYLSLVIDEYDLDGLIGNIPASEFEEMIFDIHYDDYNIDSKKI